MSFNAEETKSLIKTMAADIEANFMLGVSDPIISTYAKYSVLTGISEDTRKAHRAYIADFNAKAIEAFSKVGNNKNKIKQEK
jgi:hypothetical protein